MLRHALSLVVVFLFLLSLPREPARAQLAEFLGPHVVETLPYEIPGTGRIGGITIDGYNYLYVANQDERVWKIHPSGEVEVFIDGLYGSAGGAMLPNGDLLHAAYAGDAIVRVGRDGTVHPFVTEGLEGPVAIVVLGDAIYTPNAKSSWVARISMDGEVSEFIRDERLRIPNGITADPQGNLYVVSLGNTTILSISPDGTIGEVATLPGSGNAHVAYAAGGLYVTQIWENVVLRVEMDGSYQVVAGDGTRRLHDGPPEESRVPFPNGIAATRRGDVVYFNTLEGSMLAGHPGIIRVHKLHVPNPNRAFAEAWAAGGMGGLRAKFDDARKLREAASPQFHENLYRVGWYFLHRKMVGPGLAFIEWSAEIDGDEVRGASQVARAHFLHGDGEVATRHVERAAQMAPDSDRVQRMLETVKTYRRNHE